MYKYVYRDELPMQLMRNGKPVDLGHIWIAQTAADKRKLESLGVPYIRYGGDIDGLTKLIMFPFLESLFPGIRWKEVLGISRKKNVIVSVPGGEAVSSTSAIPASERGDVEVSDMATEERMFANGGMEAGHEIDIKDWFGTSEYAVDIVKLQSMELLPKFLSAIVSATYTRGEDLHWEDGYNKKLGICSGNFSDIQGSKNLLIIDVSASIPRSVSSTMLALADSLREQMSADLIITGGRSYYWESGQELPSAQEIRDMVPLGNECRMFKDILREHVYGKTWDNVVCFGDYDEPYVHEDEALPATIGKVYSFRVWNDGWTNRKKEEPVGYCKWCFLSCPNADYEWDVDWVQVMR